MKKNDVSGDLNRLLVKFLLVMKLTLILIVISVFAIKASTYSQSTKLNLSMTNTTVEEAFKEIEARSEFYFFYQEEEIDLERKINLDLKNAKINQILDQILEGTGLKYKIVDRYIVINPDGSGFQNNQLEPKDIKGKVTDSAGNPLPGVSIIIKGTTSGTITNSDGNFSLKNIPGDATLIFSFVGMKLQEVLVGEQTTFDIVMEDDAIGIEEVVAVGYGTQKKENLTGAVGYVSSEVLENRAIQNAGQGLQGTIANLNIKTNPGNPGKIGQGASYQIRGLGSINGGTPLILIDGVQGDLNQINPNDIESISVLKDAASAAIYGARATFGVILVTTKKGSAKEMKVSINSSVSTNSQTLYPKSVNSVRYAEVMNEAAANSGWNPIFGPEQMERIRQYAENPGSIPTTVPEPGDPSKWSYSLGNDNINYFKFYYKDAMLSHKHDFAVSGGSEIIDYRFSVGYLSQDGIYKFGEDVYKRHNFLGNVNTQFTKWLKFRFQTMFNKGVTNEPYEYARLMGNYFHIAYTRQPHWAVYDPNGNPLWTSQIQFFEGARRNTEDNELKLVGEIEIEPVEGWKINSRYSYNKMINEGVAHEAQLFAHNVDGTPYSIQPNSSITKSYAITNFESIELYSSYQKAINGHAFNLLVGGQQENYYYSAIGGYVPNLVSDEIPSLNTGTGKKNTWDDINEWVNMGLFGRLNYNYKERYLLEINARYDGTSKFPDGKRWGFFPSVSGGWNIAKEEFFNEEKINTLKLRASFGSLGNQQVANYLFFSQVPIHSNLRFLIDGDRPNYIGAPGLVSNNLAWITAETFDIGLDVAALNNRLDFSFDWYNRKTFDMIGPANALPSVLGTGVPKTNNADMVTRGFEATVGWKDKIDDFNYSLKFNLSDNLSEITKYNNPNKVLSTYYEGMKLGEIWGLETVGIIQTEEQLANMADQTTHIYGGNWNLGDIEYKDLNDDGKISYGTSTLDDPGDRKVIGNNTPRYAFGFLFDCNWKGFDFSMFWQGILKRDYWLGDIPFFGITGSWTQQVFETTTDYWTPENTNAYFARPYAHREIRKNQLVQTRFLQDASYVRLKNLQIGYTLPNRILEPFKLQKVRFYLSGENLFFISAIDENFDPERLHGSWGAGKSYPLFKTFTAGINIEF